MKPLVSLWDDLQRHGFCAHHLQMLHTLLMLGRNGSWQVHVAQGKVTQVDLRLLAPPNALAVGEVEAALMEECDRAGG